MSKDFHSSRDNAQRTLQASRQENSFVERATIIESTDGVSLEVAVTPGSESVDVAALICHPWGRIGGSMRDSVVVSLRNVLSGEGFTVCRWLL
jgi:alpha/beta superfamily hydrolase